MAVHIFTEEWTKGSASKGSIIACNYYLNKRQKRHRDEWWIAQNGMKNLLKEHSNTLFLRDFWKHHGSPKAWMVVCYFKIQKSTKHQIFWWFFCSENSFLKKSLLGGDGNWLFWTHFWIPYGILFPKTYVWHLGSQRHVFSTLRT